MIISCPAQGRIDISPAIKRTLPWLFPSIDFSPVKKEVPSVDRLTPISDYADRITAQWHKATASIMELALICAEANEVLTAPQKRQLLQRLPFKNSTFSKLAHIGQDARLHSSEMQKLLPPSYSAIYEVTLFDDATLNEAIRKKILTPKARRLALTTWRRQSKLPPPSRMPATNSPAGFYATIRLTGEISIEERERLEDLLNQIRKACNVEVIRAVE